MSRNTKRRARSQAQTKQQAQRQGNAEAPRRPDLNASNTNDDVKKEREKLRRKLMRPEKIKALLLRLLFAWVFAFSFSQMYFPMLWMPARAVQNALWILGILLLLLVLTYNKRHTLVTLGVIAIGLIVYFFKGKGATANIQTLVPRIRNLIDVLNAESSKIAEADVSPEVWNYAPEVFSKVVFIQRVIASAVALLSYLCVARYPLPLLLSTLLLLFLPITFMAPSTVPLGWAIPTILAVLLAGLSEHRITWYPSLDPKTQVRYPKFSFKRFSQFMLQSFLPILLAGLIAFAIMPFLTHKDVFSPTLQGFMDDISSMLPRSYLEKLNLKDFHLGEVGYYPLETELGGPVDLTDTPVFTLEGDDVDLLAGVYYDTYTGLLWSRAINNPYYRFNSVLDKNMQDKVFPATTPWLEAEAGRNDRWTQDVEYVITPHKDEQAVFQAGILQDIDQPRRETKLLYYNLARNLYSSEPFTQESPIHHKSKLHRNPLELTDDEMSPELKADLENLKAGDFSVPEGEWNFVYDSYLQIPDYPMYHEGGLVYDLAMQIAGNLDNSIDQVKAIMDFFQHGGFSYTLDPPPRDPSLDFVSDFLIQRQGYCVYYASATTLMARTLGIPARYVEGFAVPKELQEDLAEGKAVEIQERHAHAWSEVYIDGLGWVAVDPTPGGVDSAVNMSKDPPEPPPTEPTTTPAPTTTTTTTNPELTTTTQETTPPTTAPQDRQTRSSFPWLVILAPLLLILLALLIYLIIRRYKRHLLASLHDPVYLAERFPDLGDRLKVYWDLIRELILSESLDPHQKTNGRLQHAKGGIEEEWSTVQASERFAAYDEETKEKLKKLSQLVSRSYFSPHAIPSELVDEAAELFDQLESKLQAELSSKEYFKQRIWPQQRLKA